MGNTTNLALGFLICMLIVGAALAFLYFNHNISYNGTTTTIGQNAPVIQHYNITEKEYSISPNSITANAGEEISLRITNAGRVNHNFYLSGIGGTPDILPNQTVYLNISASQAQAGIYQGFSTDPGDRDLGMQMNLTIR